MSALLEIEDLEVTFGGRTAAVRGASLRMAYALHVGETLVGVAATEHAAVDTDGRVRRIPVERRLALKKLCAEE